MHAHHLSAFLMLLCTDSGKTLATALLKLIKNVTEPTVIKYTLARMEELLPGKCVCISCLLHYHC